jgi:hypothetical protein
MSSSSHATLFSATEAICFSGGKRLNLGKKSLLGSKAKKSSKVVVRAIQTPKKPTATSGSGESSTTSSRQKNQMEEKEAYPFEKEYKDCACCWCRLYLSAAIVFSLSLSRRRERERPYLFFRLFARVGVKSLVALSKFFFLVV